MYNVGDKVKVKTLSQLRLEFGIEDMIGIDLGFCVEEFTTAWITLDELSCLGKTGIIESVEQVSESAFRYDIVTENGTIKHIPHHLFTVIKIDSFAERLRALVDEYEDVLIKDCTIEDMRLYMEVKKCL